MQICSGLAKGMKLSAPKGRKTRPTSAVVREAVGNIFQGTIDGKTVLDLFAGTGSMGIELLSRGAKSAVFVENDTQCLKSLKQNIDEFSRRAEQQSIELAKPHIISRDVSKLLSNSSSLSGQTFDIIWADPPYTDTLDWIKTILALDYELLSPKGTLCVEVDKKTSRTIESIVKESSKWQLIKTRSYGRCAVVTMTNHEE